MFAEATDDNNKQAFDSEARTHKTIATAMNNRLKAANKRARATRV